MRGAQAWISFQRYDTMSSGGAQRWPQFGQVRFSWMSPWDRVPPSVGQGGRHRLGKRVGGRRLAVKAGFGHAPAQECRLLRARVRTRIQRGQVVAPRQPENAPRIPRPEARWIWSGSPAAWARTSATEKSTSTAWPQAGHCADPVMRGPKDPLPQAEQLLVAPTHAVAARARRPGPPARPGLAASARAPPGPGNARVPRPPEGDRRWVDVPPGEIRRGW